MRRRAKKKETNESIENEPTPSDLAESPWPSFGRDRKNTSRSSYDTSHVDGTEKWSFDTDSPVQSSPAIGSDVTIYVGSENSNLYAIG